MKEKLAIPIDFESITKDWLNLALQTSEMINQTTIETFHIETLDDGPGQTGQLARITLEYSHKSKEAPKSIIAKLSSKEPRVRAMMQKSRNYEKEVRFYLELASKTNLSTPKCFYGDIDPESGYCILLLEDLAHYCVVDISTGCNVYNAELVIQSLANFHANWWEKSEIQEIDYITPINQLAEYKQQQYQEWWLQFPQKLETALPGYQLPPAFLELGQQFGAVLLNC
ncbi:MAG: hypothetical protein HN390_04345 [Anaerolineae bacterium]|jgi:hypothetical protein|nr:hypothetical protein [Anaerolineae bacterium]